MNIDRAGTVVSDVKRDDDATDRSARQPTVVERLIVAGGTSVTVLGFLAVIGGLAAGAALSPLAWPFVGIGVLVTYLGLEWFVGRPIPVSIGIKGIDSVGDLLAALCALGAIVFFLGLLAVALWLAFGPR